LAYVPNAVPAGDGVEGLTNLGLAGQVARLTLAPAGGGSGDPTSVALFDQGLSQVLEAAVSGLQPMRSYVLALSKRTDGGGVLEPLSTFVANPAGAAIVNAIGPIRQVVRDAAADERRFIVIAPIDNGQIGAPVQVQRLD